MSNGTRCLFCDHELDGRSKLFCTRCLPPYGTWDDKREYQKLYLVLWCAVGRGAQGMERCPWMPGREVARLVVSMLMALALPPLCGCGNAARHQGGRCKDCAQRQRWATRRANRPPDWTYSTTWRDRANSHKRKARARRSSNRPTVARLAERDGWRCHLCGKRIDPKLTGTGDKHRASIDHLVPISDDGPDDMSNARLAHLCCNSRRGTGGSVQLMLVG